MFRKRCITRNFSVMKSISLITNHEISTLILFKTYIYENFEKTIESTMSSFQNHYVPTKKTVAKKTKAIAA